MICKDIKKLIAIIEDYDIPIVDSEVGAYLIGLKNQEIRELTFPPVAQTLHIHPLVTACHES